MKKVFLLIFIIIGISAQGQKSSLSFKAGITNCTTKTAVVPKNNFYKSPFDPRKGFLAGGKFNYTLTRYFSTGAEVLYLLKGHTNSITPVTYTRSVHYLSLSPHIAVFPFARSENKYISCISPEISFDINYLIADDKDWKFSDQSKYFQYELGYSLKLTYQPAKFGLQFFYFRSLSPYFSRHSESPVYDDYKYSFVTGISLLYKIFPYSKDHKK